MCVGTPAFVISQVAHQEDKARAAESVGAAINLGQAKSWDKNRLPKIFELGKESLQAMSAAGEKCIDGKGLKRVVEAILSIF
jgi:spore coat polysaccharide biosynthesis predicted glycosyltransferase SpsG